MGDRDPRTNTLREEEYRDTPWTPQGSLPVPEPRDGLHFRWIRTGSLGTTDMANVSRRLREGYTPVLASEFPELKTMSDVGTRFPKNIEVGGLLLCSIPSEQAERRIQGQAQIAAAQMTAVDQNLLRESDPRMPVSAPERRTRITFGTGE